MWPPAVWNPLWLPVAVLGADLGWGGGLTVLTERRGAGRVSTGRVVDPLGPDRTLSEPGSHHYRDRPLGKFPLTLILEGCVYLALGAAPSCLSSKLVTHGWRAVV